MATARKLFPSYGSAVAQAFCHALERDGLVQNFIAGYAQEFDRRAVAATAAQERELETTIGREALLAMTIEVREQLPRFFGKRRGEEKLDAHPRDGWAPPALPDNWKRSSRDHGNSRRRERVNRVPIRGTRGPTSVRCGRWHGRSCRGPSAA